MKRRIWFYGSLALALGLVGVYATVMPGARHQGPHREPSSEAESLAVALKAHVVALSATVGERRIDLGDSLKRAEDYVASVTRRVAESRPATVRLEDVGPDGGHANNVILEFPGGVSDLVLVGAHYDSAAGTPGADDNASGVAAALELARLLSLPRFKKTLRFVLFANEEPPYFRNPGMGSLTHARGCRARGEHIDAVLVLESMGFYSSAPESQRYPWPLALLYPSRGDFIGFVGNLRSRSLVRQSTAIFRELVRFPSEGAALPASLPGVGWSDHWSFWKADYPAIMVTDTAPYRNPNYHEPTDTHTTLDYARLASVTLGLQKVIESLAVRV